MKNWIKGTVIIALFCLSVWVKPVLAQCAQCAASVESNAKNGGTSTAKGLNNGILFLLAAPYLAGGIGAYVWYKKYRRKNVQLEMREHKLNMN